MDSATPTPEAVLAVFDTLGPPGTPMTTAEVAAEFDCTDRTIYNKLEVLIEGDRLETKKVGARGRVWWRPGDCDGPARDGERGQTEARLRESRAKLEVALDAGGMGTWEWDLDAETVDGDERFFELFGLPHTDEPVDIKDFLEKEAPESVDRAEVLMDEGLKPGETVKGETRLDGVDGAPRWLGWRGQASVDDQSVLYGISFDITERKRREQRQQFVVELTDAIRSLADPVEIKQAAARVLGEWLGVGRAHYAEIGDDEDAFRIETDYTRDGVPSVAGEHRLSNYGEHVPETLRAGERLVITDTHSVSGVSGEKLAAYEDTETHAHVTVPLVKDDHLTAFFSADSMEPRTWSDVEVDLIAETAERT